MQDAHLNEGSAKPVRRLKAGDVLIEENEPADQMYWIASGQVQVMKADPMGHRPPVMLGLLGPQDLVGEVGFLSPDKQRSASVVCLTDCEVLSFSSQELEAELSKLSPDMQTVLMTLLRRVQETNWCLVENKLGRMKQITHRWG
ncbi:MAG: cyclic nucleotide-binding domain-containing protein [Candidatus Melainabacteria bacterium]|nr:cyclic nucleotide-binding domain-containing protein [Candidatus Melainabacteria bacterium]